MELSESERLMLVRKKEEIFKITSELLTNSELTKSEKISKMNEILSLLSTIESYAKMHRDIYAIQKTVILISSVLDLDEDACGLITIFCTAVNSIRFDFTKKGLALSMPVKFEAILNKFQVG